MLIQSNFVIEVEGQYYFEWVNDCCSTPNEEFVSHIMARKS